MDKREEARQFGLRVDRQYRNLTTAWKVNTEKYKQEICLEAARVYLTSSHDKERLQYQTEKRGWNEFEAESKICLEKAVSAGLSTAATGVALSLLFAIPSGGASLIPLAGSAIALGGLVGAVTYFDKSSPEVQERMVKALAEVINQHYSADQVLDYFLGTDLMLEADCEGLRHIFAVDIYTGKKPSEVNKKIRNTSNYNLKEIFETKYSDHWYYWSGHYVWWHRTKDLPDIEDVEQKMLYIVLDGRAERAEQLGVYSELCQCSLSNY
ncbi:hypothetical protein [Synechococcus elongatus]|uniref:hypothetical protein n=1 Tax=Synechococcus elongatus TaxID=32046 RepID=UPI000F7F49B6|nr:hypothetical protein [Synechococcus elongatus]